MERKKWLQELEVQKREKLAIDSQRKIYENNYDNNSTNQQQRNAFERTPRTAWGASEQSSNNYVGLRLILGF